MGANSQACFQWLSGNEYGSNAIGAWTKPTPGIDPDLCKFSYNQNDTCQYIRILKSINNLKLRTLQVNRLKSISVWLKLKLHNRMNKPGRFCPQQRAHEESSKREHHKPAFEVIPSRLCEDQTWGFSRSFFVGWFWFLECCRCRNWVANLLRTWMKICGIGNKCEWREWMSMLIWGDGEWMKSNGDWVKKGRMKKRKSSQHPFWPCVPLTHPIFISVLTNNICLN